MNVRQYFRVKVQLVIWFRASLFLYTLATFSLCPTDCIQETLRQKKGRTSHLTLGANGVQTFSGKGHVIG